MKKYTLALILGSLSLTACTDHNVQKTVHEGKVNTEAKPLGSDSEVGKLKSVDADLKVYNELIGDNSASQNKLVQHIESLSKTVLNSDNILDSDVARSPKMLDCLLIFNQLLLQGLSKYPADTNLAQILSNYEKLMLRGIDDNRTAYKEFFGQSHLSAEVLGKIVERRWVNTKKEDLVRDYRHLQYALFENRNTNESPFLFSLYLKRSADYAQRLQADSNKDLTQEHIARIQLILRHIDRSIVANCPRDVQTHKIKCASETDKATYNQMKQFLTDSQVWSLSKQSSATQSALGPSLTKLAMHFMYDENGNLTPELAKIISESQKASNSLAEQLTRLKAQMGKGPLLEIGFDPDVFFKADQTLKPEYQSVQFDIVRRLFNNEISPENAAEMWQNSMAESKDKLLVLLVRGQTQVAVLDKVLDTRNRLQTIFINQKLINESKKEFIDTVFREARELSIEWKDLLENVDRTLVLSRKFLRRSEVTLQDEDFNQLENTLGGIKQNIGLLAVFPNQMMMSYLLASNSTSEELKSLYESQRPTDMFSNAMNLANGRFGLALPLFEKGLPFPWFDFGSSNVEVYKASKWEILLANVYAAATGVFSTPKSLTQEASDPAGTSIVAQDMVSFAKLFIDSILENERSMIKSATDKVRSDMSSDKYTKFLNTCSVLSASRAIWQKSEADSVNQWQDGSLRVLNGMPIEFNYLPSSVLIGQYSMSAEHMFVSDLSPMRAAMDLVPGKDTWSGVRANSSMGFLMDRLATEGKNQMVYWRSWVEFMRTFYKNSAPTLAVDQELARVEALLNEHEVYIAAANTNAKLIYDEVGTCAPLIEDYENRVKKAVIASEVAELGKAYRNLQGATEPMAYQEILSDPTLAQYNFKEEFTLDSSAKTFEFTRFGALLKIRKFIQDLTGAKISVPSGLTSATIYTKNRGTSVRLSLDKANSEFEFAKPGLAFAFGSRSSVTSWQINSEFRRNLAYMAIKLFGVGKVSYFTDGEKACPREVVLSQKALREGKKCSIVAAKKYLVSADEVIDAVLKFGKVFDITADDYEKINRYTGAIAVRDQIEHFYNFFIDPNTGKNRGIVEPAYSELNGSTNLAASGSLGILFNNTPPQVEVSRFYNEMVRPTSLMFKKKDDAYLNILKQAYATHLTDSLEAEQEFECAIGRRAYLDRNLPKYQVTYQVDPNDPSSKKTISSEIIAGKATYLSESYVGTQERARRSIFNTVGAFLNSGLAKDKQITPDRLANRYRDCFEKASKANP